MPWNRENYPERWEQISDRIRFGRAEGRCECTGECGDVHPAGRCRAEHGVPHPLTSATVVLTVAHYPDRTKTNTDEDNLLALCQRCHLRLDEGQHRRNRKYGRHHDADHQLNLFDG